MGLHTDYLGGLRIEPALSPAEVDFLKSFNRTRHCGDRAVLDVVAHPADDNCADDVASSNRVATGMPGLWCPWTCCDEGCCLRWDGGEKPYAPGPLAALPHRHVPAPGRSARRGCSRARARLDL